jgi:hypothetical protein
MSQTPLRHQGRNAARRSRNSTIAPPAQLTQYPSWRHAGALHAPVDAGQWCGGANGAACCTTSPKDKPELIGAARRGAQRQRV